MPFKEKILIVVDFDRSFYNGKLHQNQINKAKQEEYELIAELKTKLGTTSEQVQRTISTEVQKLKISTLEIIRNFLSYEQWLKIRLATSWYNELHLNEDAILDGLPNNCRVVIASHTPLEVIKLAFDVYQNKIPIYGPEELGCYKPEQEFFWKISKLEAVSPNRCIYIGDSLKYDIFSAMRAGYLGAVITEGQAIQMINQIAALATIENHLTSFQLLMMMQCWDKLKKHMGYIRDDTRYAKALNRASRRRLRLSLVT